MTSPKFGTWWEPQRPDVRVPGSLYETEGGALRLHLNGQLGQAEGPPLAPGTPRSVQPPLNDIPILLGSTSEGKFLTLIDCRVLSASGVLGLAPITQEIQARIIAYDAHFAAREEFRLKSLSMRFSNLDQWVAISGFFVSEPQSVSFAVQVGFALPAPIQVTLSNGMTVSIDFSATGPTLGAVITDVSIAQRAWLTVTSPGEIPYEDLLKALTVIADLVALGIGNPLRAQECDASAFDSNSTTQPPAVFHFRLHHNGEPIAPVLPEVNPFDMLFTLPDIRERLAHILDAWCGQQDNIKPLYSLYFGTLRSPSMYVEHRFLNMFQALEAFDRRNYVPSPASTQRHQDRLQRILAATTSLKDCKWLTGRLRYSHEPAAADRLTRLAREYDAEWVFMDTRADIELATNLRNFYTHYDSDLEQKLPPPEERPGIMHNLAVRLQLLCEIILLRQVGFDAEQLKRRMHETKRLGRRLVRLGKNS